MQVTEKDKEGKEQAKGYCVKCKTKRVIKNPKPETLKNGKKAIRGICDECGTKMIVLGVK